MYLVPRLLLCVAVLAAACAHPYWDLEPQAPGVHRYHGYNHDRWHERQLRAGKVEHQPHYLDGHWRQGYYPHGYRGPVGWDLHGNGVPKRQGHGRWHHRTPAGPYQQQVFWGRKSTPSDFTLDNIGGAVPVHMNRKTSSPLHHHNRQEIPNRRVELTVDKGPFDGLFSTLPKTNVKAESLHPKDHTTVLYVKGGGSDVLPSEGAGGDGLSLDGLLMALMGMGQLRSGSDLSSAGSGKTSENDASPRQPETGSTEVVRKVPKSDQDTAPPLPIPFIIFPGGGHFPGQKPIQQLVKPFTDRKVLPIFEIWVPEAPKALQLGKLSKEGPKKTEKPPSATQLPTNDAQKKINKENVVKQMKTTTDSAVSPTTTSSLDPGLRSRSKGQKESSGKEPGQLRVYQAVSVSRTIVDTPEPKKTLDKTKYQLLPIGAKEGQPDKEDMISNTVNLLSEVSGAVENATGFASNTEDYASTESIEYHNETKTTMPPKELTTAPEEGPEEASDQTTEPVTTEKPSSLQSITNANDKPTTHSALPTPPNPIPVQTHPKCVEISAGSCQSMPWATIEHDQDALSDSAHVLEYELNELAYLKLFPGGEKCLDAIRMWFCADLYPKCDIDHPELDPKPLCQRKACQERHEACRGMQIDRDYLSCDGYVDEDCFSP